MGHPSVPCRLLGRHSHRKWFSLGFLSLGGRNHDEPAETWQALEGSESADLRQLAS